MYVSVMIESLVATVMVIQIAHFSQGKSLLNIIAKAKKSLIIYLLYFRHLKSLARIVMFLSI